MSIPQEVLESVPQDEFKHAWLYSVIPIGVRAEGRRGEVDYPLRGFLTGYCRNCDNMFSVQLPTERYGKYVTEKAGVPQFGCVNPLAGL
jgi:hypothetical protein